MKAAVVIYLTAAATIFKTLIGPGRRRGQVMLVGTLAGVASGVLVAYPMTAWLNMDTSVICVCLGLTAGWAAAWHVARRVPGGAP
jgi:hypothetical protein